MLEKFTHHRSLALPYGITSALSKIENTRYITKNITIKGTAEETWDTESTTTQRTSIRLTAYQWSSLEWICHREDISQPELFGYIAQRIDWTVLPEHKYQRGQNQYSLSNAVRIFIIAYFRVLLQESRLSEDESFLEMDTMPGVKGRPIEVDDLV